MLKAGSGEEIAEAIMKQLMREAGVPTSFAWMAEPFRQMARDMVASGLPYLMVEKEKAILCLTCGLVSHNPNDVAQKYCGACQEFHERS